MTDKVESAAPAVAAPKKAVAPKTKKPAPKPTHPPTADMVNTAIRELKERSGSSLQAIKKYISITYKLDVDKLAFLIRRYLKSAVAKGTLIQPKGKGASGSFKFPPKKRSKSKTQKLDESKVEKKPAPEKKVAPKAKKAVGEKKKSTKVAAKPPKAKSTTAKSKVTKASAKKTTKAASPMKKASASKSRKPAAKKTGKK